MKTNELVIGLFGFGVVGEGLYRVLQQTPSLQARIKKICIKDPGKQRKAPPELFTTDGDALLFDPEINVIVEVINETGAALHIARTALNEGKHLVSASKKMIAENLPELLELQEKTGRSFLYEAAACASIPVIRNLEEYYDNDLLHGISAIVNGSTNYILTKMFDEQLSFRDALLQAQQLGFAETDPTLDVEGYDALNKWVILLNHAYGILAAPDEILCQGIRQIQASDAAVAREKQFVVKLVANARKLENGQVAAFVMPQFVRLDEQLAFVRNEYNGVVIESGFADEQFFYGKGAGSLPTASAVLSDISALRYQYRYEYKKGRRTEKPALTDDFHVRVYVSFDDVENIRKDDFLFIEEWHANEKRNYLVGVLPFATLRKASWWRENNNTLILLPDAIVEDIDLRAIKKKSLALAGVTL